jgi:hypothetical protein
LQSPDNGVTFDNATNFSLTWTPVDLPANHYYVLHIQHRLGDDYTWLTEPTHNLYDAQKEWLINNTLANSELRWRVAIATAINPADGQTPETFASNWSEQRTFIWTEVGTGGGGGSSPITPTPKSEGEDRRTQP